MTMNNPHLFDAWLDAIPEDAYDPCPCGCGKKWRYIVREGEAEIEKHFQAWLKEKSNDS